jgi:hypothetical protein
MFVFEIAPTEQGVRLDVKRVLLSKPLDELEWDTLVGVSQE